MSLVMLICLETASVWPGVEQFLTVFGICKVDLPILHLQLNYIFVILVRITIDLLTLFYQIVFYTFKANIDYFDRKNIYYIMFVVVGNCFSCI